MMIVDLTLLPRLILALLVMSIIFCHVNPLSITIDGARDQLEDSFLFLLSLFHSRPPFSPRSIRVSGF